MCVGKPKLLSQPSEVKLELCRLCITSPNTICVVQHCSSAPFKKLCDALCCELELMCKGSAAQSLRIVACASLGAA